MKKSVMDQIVEIGRRMYNKGYVASNDGNISFRDGDAIYCTRTGVSKGFMKADDISLIDIDGNVIDGPPVSSEVKLHLMAYKVRPDIKACVHAHPPYTTSYAIAGVCLDSPILPELVYHLGRIPLAPYATPSSEGLALSIRDLISSHDAVMLEFHGALTVGIDPDDAYFKLETMEHLAYIKHLLDLRGVDRHLNERQVEDIIALRRRASSSGRNPYIRD